MEWTTAEGKTYKVALDSLLKTLGADQSEVEIEDLGEHRKYLGLGKPIIRMRGRLKREAFEDAPQPVKTEPKKIRPATKEKSEKQPTAEQKDLSEVATKSKELLQSILQTMNIGETEISATEGNRSLVLNIVSNKGGLIIGHKGETLEALQTILDIFANRQQEERVRVIVDTENYRSRREDMLLSMAKKSAREAINTGRQIFMGPMRPADRKLIHSCLQDNPKVTTKSEGEGNGRQVVVLPN